MDLFSSSRAPSYNNPNWCRQQIENLNPTDLNGSLQTVEHLLEGMLTTPPKPIEHLNLLESLRDKLDFLLSEIAQRYASRPLPPLSAEDQTLSRVVDTWLIVEKNYALVAHRGASEPRFNEQRAMIAQRRIHYHSRAMIEYFRARREMPKGYWNELHKLYALAEEWGVTKVRVPEPLNELWHAQNPAEAYIAILLVDAGNPYSRTPREFVWMLRWAERFAPYCSFSHEASTDKRSGYVIDLSDDQSLRPQQLVSPGQHALFLDSKKLAAHIHATASQLKNGILPASLGLGEDCVQPACSRLLISLYRPWGLASAGRRFVRKMASGTIPLCTDIAAIAFYINGKEFTQPGQGQRTSFAKAEAAVTFGEMVENNIRPVSDLEIRAAQLGYSLETWNIANQSVSGFSLTRNESGSRVEHRQLVGVAATEDGRFLLAEISWLRYEQNGLLTAGLNILPGTPEVVGIRLAGPKLKNRYQIGFMLPAVPGLKVEASLIIPAGWSQGARTLEVHSEQNGLQSYQVTHLIGRGINFDRVTYAPASAA